jgi:DNA gyrase subunit A
MGVKGIKLTEARGAAVIGARMVDLEDEVILVSSGGVLIRTSVSEIAEQRRDATGVKVMNVGEAETVAALSPVTIEDEDEVEETVEETVGSDAVS